MNSSPAVRRWCFIPGVTVALLLGQAQGQLFTVRVGDAPPPPTPLVEHFEVWHYHKGTNAPQSDWKTAQDAELNATWATGPGGFGYSTDTPNEVAMCQTLLPDMFNNYTTVYLRRSFEVTEALDPNQHLLLTMDWDDGFVAYLDGVELTRDRARTTAGVEPAFDDRSSSNHESSRGTSSPVNPPMTFDLGALEGRLAPGTHVLGILCLNGALNSSDLIMIADLALGPASSGIVDGPLLAVVKAAEVPLSGTNTVNGSTRVTVNGEDAVFAAATGLWSKNQTLQPGCNRLVVEALDENGAVLFSTNQTVVSELSSTVLDSLGASTTLDPSMGIIHVTNSLTLPTGGTLHLQAGTVVLLGPGVNLHAALDGTIVAEGTGDQPVCLLTADGRTMWGEIAADGAGSTLTLRHVEAIGGAVKGRNGAACTLENCYFHDYKNGSVPIGGCTSAQFMVVRGCHFRTYHETLWQHTLMTVEDSLFELADNPSSDALDFDGAIVGSVIRHCTFRHGPNSNTDAIDIGPTGAGIGSTNTIIENCQMFDFPTDKGISIGEGSYGIVVRNCLMYGDDAGVAVKDSPGGKPPCTAIVHHCTIVNNDFAFRLYNKSDPNSMTDGGQITNSYDNILWGNGETLSILNGGILIADHTDFAMTNYPGVGNFDADPLFLDAAERDYRLAPGSPCRGSGRDGADLGAIFPVGCAMAPSHPYFQSIVLDGDTVRLGFWVDSERNYSVETSEVAQEGTWSKMTDVYHQMVPRLVELTDTHPGTTKFYRLVTRRL